MPLGRCAAIGPRAIHATARRCGAFRNLSVGRCRKNSEDDLNGGDIGILDRLEPLLDALHAHAIACNPAVADEGVHSVEDLRSVVDIGRQCVKLNEVEAVHIEVLARTVDPSSKVFWGVLADARAERAGRSS